MELGMIGLGRMGANMVERLMKAGHSCVVYDSHADRCRGWSPRAPRAPPTCRRSSSLSKPRAVWLMLPAGGGRSGAALAGAAAGAGRHRHRRRQFLLPRRHPPRRRAEGQGAALRRCRRQRRRLGPGARLLPYDRRRGRCREAPRPDLPLAGARASTRRRARRAPPASRARPSTATCIAARTAPATS